MYHVRLMKIEDIPSVARIANQSFFEAARYIDWVGEVLIERIKRFPKWQFVAEEEKKIVGFAVNEKTDEGVHLCLIAILPGFQGREIGGKLLHFLEKKTRSSGIKKIWLDTPYAKNFYLQHGFAETSRIYRVMKEIAGKIIEKGEGIKPLKFDDLEDALSSLPPKEKPEFLTWYFKAYEAQGNLILGVEGGEGWRGIGIGKDNKYCAELLEIKFIWAETVKDKLRIIKGFEYMASTFGKRWVGIATADERFLSLLLKNEYRDEKNPIFWTQYNMEKILRRGVK